MSKVIFKGLIVLLAVFTVFTFQAQVPLSHDAKSKPDTSQNKIDAYEPCDTPTKIIYPTNFFVSKPVRDMPVCDDLVTFDGLIVPKDGVTTTANMSAKRKRKLAHLNAAGRSSTVVDPLIVGPENYTNTTPNRAPLVSFESLGLNVSPPDPSMAVGPNHIVTMENGQWAVYDKTGTMAAGFPKLLTDPLSTAGNPDNAGDPVVMYDREADRWFLSQFQLSAGPQSSNAFLVGISTTPDPTGSYNVYEYNLTAGNDYPHYGVWGDSYVTAGNFTGAQKVYTFNRTKMLAGDSTAEIAGFSPSGLGASGFAAPIPVHSEGAGAATGDIKIVYYQDDAFSGVTSDHIGLWNIDMDWTNATTISNSTISGKNQIPTAAFDAAIAGGFSNLQQPGTTQRIDAIVGAVMNMCHWYEFGTHQSIVMNWVVEIVDGSRISGIRWVELRSLDGGASWSVYQEGTFTDPTGNESVFMGCISMDIDGNIGLGYTKTGSTTFPSLYYTGRLATDPLGTMTFAEDLAVAGTASVTNNDRYGDYGQGVRDPNDDKTFWVTSEYSGSANRQVRVYSFKIEAATPIISFANASDNSSEGDPCFTDINVPLNIGLAPSANATVNFTINASSTATTGLDFDLITPNVVFPTGSTASQNMVLRVYHDGLVEIDETVIVDFTVNPNGGDATANPNANTFTLNITSDDAVPSSGQVSTLFSEDFESYNDFLISNIGGWTMLDNDGDQTYGSVAYDFTNENYTGTFIVFNPSQTSPSAAGTIWDAHGGNKGYYCFNESVAPFGNDDYIFTPQINLNGTNSELKFWAKSLTDQFGLERFQVGISTTDTNPGSFTYLTTSPYEEAPTTWNEYTYDLSAYDGMTIYVTFHVVSSDAFVFMLDDISITANTSSDIQTAVNLATQDQLQINGTGTVYSSDAASGNVMLDISNNNSDDYDCVDIYVSRSGTGAQSYNGSTTPNLVMDKVFDVVPTTPSGSGNTTVTFYFEEAEIAGWEADVGGMVGVTRNTLVIGRETAGGLTETATPIIGNFGSGVTLTGNFTGLSDKFYFGASAAFASSCAGLTKTWNGTDWNPDPGITPGSSDAVVIDGSYDTSVDGNINACTLTILTGRTLTINGGGFANVEGDISVNGTASLIVEHQGSVVQTDPNASVTKAAGATINVELTSPSLAGRDFMVMGSPMDVETDAGVFGSALYLLGHTPANFLPHPSVPAGGTNFADDDQNFWNPYTGTIHPGEGFLVRPQASVTAPPQTYNFTYALGTLNNGNISRTMFYNPAISAPNATPNILANPYPSAISAEDFINANALVNEIYLWEHVTPPGAFPGSGAVNYNMEDISMYNLSGWNAPASDPGATNNLGAPMQGRISTGQGFGIKVDQGSPTTVSFTNTMRRTSGNTTLRSPDDVDKIYLKVSGDTYALGSNTLIAFNPEATSNRDAGYDSDRLATIVSLYSHLPDGSEQLAIQTREAFEDGIKIPMGFSSQVTEETSYTIAISSIEGANLTTATVYLIDHHQGVITNLNEADYSFSSDEGTFNERFTLQFESDGVLTTPEASLESISIYPNPTSGILNIVSPKTPINGVVIYDVQGRKIRQIDFNTESAQIDFSSIEASMYFVEIRTELGSVTKQIIKK